MDLHLFQKLQSVTIPDCVSDNGTCSYRWVGRIPLGVGLCRQFGTEDMFDELVKERNCILVYQGLHLSAADLWWQVSCIGWRATCLHSENAPLPKFMTQRYGIPVAFTVWSGNLWTPLVIRHPFRNSSISCKLERSCRPLPLNSRRVVWILMWFEECSPTSMTARPGTHGQCLYSPGAFTCPSTRKGSYTKFQNFPFFGTRNIYVIEHVHSF